MFTNDNSLGGRVFRKNVTALLYFSKPEIPGSRSGEGDDVFQNLWLGCTIAAISNVVIAAGLNVQKYTHMRLTVMMGKNGTLADNTSSSIPTHNRTPVGNSASACAENAANQTNASNVSLKYWRFPLWWLGIALLVVGELGNFVAYGVAPASAIAPLGITCVVANVGIARVFLKETLRMATLIGSCIGVIGAVLLVLFIAKENDTILDPKGVEAAVTQPYFVLYLTGLAVAIVVLFLLYYIQRTKSLLVILFIANILAAITVISAKAVSGFAVLFLRGSLSVYGLLSQPVLYFLVLCVIITGITQVKYVQDALAIYPATFVVPVNYILFTLSAITAGIIFYGELLGLGQVNIIIFIVGCILCFVGVFLITDDGRACTTANNRDNTSTIGEMSSFGTGAQITTTSSAGASADPENQNRMLTLLRDCVKITQTKFELQPLLHSSPAQQQQQQLQVRHPPQLQHQQSHELGEQKKQFGEEKPGLSNTLTARHGGIVPEPSPIARHLHSPSDAILGGVVNSKNPLPETTTLAVLSPNKQTNNENVEASMSAAEEKQIQQTTDGNVQLLHPTSPGGVSSSISSSTATSSSGKHSSSQNLNDTTSDDNKNVLPQ